MEYNPPPVGVVLESDLAGGNAERYASNIEYRPNGTTLSGDSCTTFPEAAKPAVVAALNIWSTVLNSPVPVRVSVCWAALNPDFLAQAGPTNYV